MNKKIKSAKTVIFSIAALLVSIFIVIGILAYLFLNSFSGFSTRNEFSEYDKKVYTVTSPDGKLSGSVGTKMVSCGEFPGDLCLDVYYNILVKDNIPENVSDNNRSSYSIFDSNYYYVANVYDVVEKLSPFDAILEPIFCNKNNPPSNPFGRDGETQYKCASNAVTETGQTDEFIVSFLKIIRSNESPKDFLKTRTLQIYDASNSTLRDTDGFEDINQDKIMDKKNRIRSYEFSLDLK